MTSGTQRPFIGMHFTCCNVYVRIYLNKGRTAFVGYCPKCTRKAVVKVGSQGSRARFWSAG